MPATKQALYHQDGRDPKLLDVLHENADGTVNLGLVGEGERDEKDNATDKVLVTRCQVCEAPTPGSATLVSKADVKKIEAAAEAAAPVPDEPTPHRRGHK